MPNALRAGKRAFTLAVVMATILWSVGIAAFTLPLSASAQTLEDGDLFRTADVPTVYYYYGGERFIFPNETTFNTWYDNFDNVQVVDDATVSALPIGENIVIRPGTHLGKVTTDPKVYAVTRAGELVWLETAAVAEAIYGANWADWVVDIPDSFFVDYTVGPSMIEGSEEFLDGMLIDGSTYILWDGLLHELTGTAMEDNRLQDRFLLTDYTLNLGDYSMGDAFGGPIPALTDTSQQATGLVEVADGDLDASLSSENPSPMTVPAGATGVPFMGVTLDPVGGMVNVSGLTFDFTGIADTSVVDEMFLYEGTARLTNGKSVNSSTRQVSFASVDMDLSSSTDLLLSGDIADAATLGGTATAGFQLPASGIGSNAMNVNGSFPLAGPLHTLTDASEVGTADFDETGSLSDVTIGQSNAEIAKFSVDMSGEDGLFEFITLNVDEADDHAEYQLWQGSTWLADCSNIGNDLVNCPFDSNYIQEDGKTKTYTMTATVGGSNGEDIRTGLEEVTDASIIGQDFGFGLEITNGYGDTGGSCASSADDCSFVDIIGGQLTVANNNLPTGDILIGGDDQALFDFSVTSENWTQVNQFQFDIDGDDLCDGTTGPNFSNWSILMGASTLMGPEEFDTTCASADADAKAVTFDDEFDMQSGVTYDLLLTTNVEDTADADSGEEITATMDSSETQAEDNQGDDLVVGTDIIPSANYVGNTQTLVDSSLTIDIAATPSDGVTVVQGSQGVDMVGFSFTTGPASSADVLDASFTILVEGDSGTDVFLADGGDFEPEDYVVQCSLFDGNGVFIDGPESPDSTGSLDFNSFLWTVPADDTEEMVVNCNHNNLDVEGGDDDDYAIRLDDVTAEDEESDEITETINEDNDDDGDQPEVAITVTDVGDIDAEISPATPDESIIIGGGDAEIEIGRWRLTADTEAFRMTDAVLRNDDGDGGDDGCNGGACSDDVATDIYLNCLDASGVAQKEDGTFTGGDATFSGLVCHVPADGSADVWATIKTNDVSATGADSGDLFTLSFLDDDGDGFEAIGLSSQTTVTETTTNGDPQSDVFELRKTKPTISEAAGNPPNQAGVPGLEEVLRFNVSADSHGYVGLEELAFKLTSQDLDGVDSSPDWNECDSAGGASGDNDPATGWEQEDFSLYNIEDLGDELDVDGDWDLLDSGGATCADNEDVRYALLDFTTEPEVAAGTTDTFSLWVDTLGASSGDDDTFSAALPRSSEVAGLGNITDTVVWSDDTQATGVEADLLDTLPVNGGTFLY